MPAELFISLLTSDPLQTLKWPLSVGRTPLPQDLFVTTLLFIITLPRWYFLLPRNRSPIIYRRADEMIWWSYTTSLFYFLLTKQTFTFLLSLGWLEHCLFVSELFVIVIVIVRQKIQYCRPGIMLGCQNHFSLSRSIHTQWTSTKWMDSASNGYWQTRINRESK